MTIFKVWQFSEKVLRVKQTRIKSAWKYIQKNISLQNTYLQPFQVPVTSDCCSSMSCWHHLSLYFWPIVWRHVAVVSILLWGIPLNYLGQASPGLQAAYKDSGHHKCCPRGAGFVSRTVIITLESFVWINKNTKNI